MLRVLMPVWPFIDLNYFGLMENEDFCLCIVLRTVCLDILYISGTSIKQTIRLTTEKKHPLAFRLEVQMYTHVQ